MAICRIKQPEIFSSGTVNDNLTPANAPSSANLEEDLNYIRSVLKAFFGTPNWYDVPSGNFNEVLDAFPVQHYVESDDPAKKGYHKDIIADSLTIDAGNFSITNPTGTTAVSLDIDSWTSTISGNKSESINGSYSLTANAGLTFSTAAGTSAVLQSDTFYIQSSSGVGFAFFNASAESLDFIGSLSNSNKLLGLQQGYEVYSDNEGPLGEAGGSRLWIDGPDGTTNAAGVVIGPRVGSNYFSHIRLRARTTQLEGGGNALRVLSDLDSSSTAHTLAEFRSNDGNGLAFHVTGTRKIIAPINSGTIDWSHEISFDSGTNRWEVEVGSFMQITSPTGWVQIGSANTGHAHFYTDRPDYYFNKGLAIDGGIKFWQVSQSKQYRIFMGSTFPTTPQDGDIWFKV